MKFATALGAFCLAVAADAAGDRSYTDDLGITHTTSIEKPTIVTFAHAAVSFFDYGLGTDQLLGTYGEYVVTGSDFDFEQPEQTSSYNADPEPEDIKKLLSTTNLSPGCERVPGYCTEFDIEGLVQLDPDYLIVQGYAHSPWAIANFTEVELAFPKTKIIYNDVSLAGENCTVHENCVGKSMIDLVEQYQELAAFLNLEEQAQLQQDMAELCAAAGEFQTHMKTAHDKGIRTMAAYVDPSSAFYASPINDMVLRMFEELGMPILHIGKCEDCSQSYFWETIPSEAYFASCDNSTDFEECNEDTLYPVDVWLYDHRTRAVINNEDFAVVFPDKAVLTGQFAEWPIGGRKITPRHAIEILKAVGPSVAGADRLHDETPCVPDLDVSGMEYRRSNSGGDKGAGGGAYACYDTSFHNSKYFMGCGGATEEATDSNPGACYDMQVHQCDCESDRCSAELCTADGGIWSAECPSHCKDCASPDTMIDSMAEEEKDSHDKEEHDSHEHDSHDEGSSDDETGMEESSAYKHSWFGAVAVASVFAVRASL